MKCVSLTLGDSEASYSAGPLASGGSGSEALRALISEPGALTCLPGPFGVKGSGHRHLNPQGRCIQSLVPSKEGLCVWSPGDSGGGGGGWRPGGRYGEA